MLGTQDLKTNSSWDAFRFIFSALFGTKIPGEGCVYVAQSLQFKRPVYLGDTVVATVTVTKVDLDKRRVFLEQLVK